MENVSKVLMLVENLSVPSDPRVWMEATTLRDSGFQISIICPKGKTQCQESYICLENIHVYRYKVPTITNTLAGYIVEYGVALLMTFILSLKVLFRHGFDVIHAANPPDLFFIIGLFYRLLRKKYVFDQHDLSPELFQVKFKSRKLLFHKLLVLLERFSYRTAHLVIVTNLTQKRFAVERGRCCPAKVFVVRNGPDLRRIQLVTPQKELKGERRYLLAYVGVMGIQDGVDYTLYALHDLVYKRGRQDVALILMGHGDFVPSLQRLTRELQLESYVSFSGWLEIKDLVRYLAVADVGLSPDPQNGLNEFCTTIKTMEYMAMGKPVVAFDLAETRFSAQDAALYAIPNCVEDFADKIEALLADEELRLKMGAVGRKYIEEKLSWDRSKEHLLHAYEFLLHRSIEPSFPERRKQGKKT